MSLSLSDSRLLDLSVRQVNGLLVLASIALMLVAIFLQEVDELHPCPLCISQRICVIGVGVFAALAFLHNPGKAGVRVYAVMQILSAVMGVAIAGRHLWIQSLPADQVPACGPGLQYIFDNFPFMDALSLLFRGDGSCAEVQLFLFLPIPAWVLITCLFFVGICCWQFFRAAKLQS